MLQLQEYNLVIDQKAKKVRFINYNYRKIEELYAGLQVYATQIEEPVEAVPKSTSTIYTNRLLIVDIKEKVIREGLLIIEEELKASNSNYKLVDNITILDNIPGIYIYTIEVVEETVNDIMLLEAYIQFKKVFNKPSDNKALPLYHLQDLEIKLKPGFKPLFKLL